ncbi:MAG: tRNA lysidine(34) synthetase TilS [Firmicutes bacterium]|nr:tRNA lysidine(34) synthetase TilS [Bacillota bacterium]
MGNIIKIFNQTLKKYDMLPKTRQNVLVAVSGGADSVALLHLLFELTKTIPIKIIACHVNHNLRGEQSLADATFVQNLCNRLNISCYVYSVEIPQNGQSLEEAARNIRYSQLKKCGVDNNVSIIALGHNQNDNAETLILRLSRGTGLKGLCGIPPVRRENGFTFIRPLINVPRTEIENFLNEQNIPYCTDFSNFDTKFSRNAVRLDILPKFLQINANSIGNIANTANLLSEDEELLQMFTTQIFEECCVKSQNSENGENMLNISTLQKYPIAMQKRIIRLFLAEFSRTNETTGLKDISQKHITQILELTKNETGKETHLPQKIIVSRNYNFLSIYTNKKIEPQNFCIDITKNSLINIPNLGHYLVATTKTANLTFTKNFNCLCTKQFNYDKIRGTLQLRTRKPGDHIYINKVGTKKLKDELSDSKMPKTRRNAVPLLAMGNEIIWIIDDQHKNYGRVNNAFEPINGCTILNVAILTE